ncbi:MAG: hypothetical protein IT371_25165 [Deltaproteobacteria bacterium]|nr:hypothetical protein [Deltaproteobacteria bacterium]
MKTLLAFLVVAAALPGCGPSIPEPRSLPAGKSFAGLWDSNWGQMQLMQEGTRVHGPFKGFRNGSVSGEVKGDLYIFRWTQMENQQFGRGYLQMSLDGNALEGRWGYQSDPANGGRWWATRATP